MSLTPSTAAVPKQIDRILDIVRQYWGFDALRPLQAEAIGAALGGRDSLVVMPTGGGKSLCYQVPPLLDDSLDIVVSPLISLMKDQVDGLRTCGYPAAACTAGFRPTSGARRKAGLAAGKFRLLFLAPERLVNSWFLQLAGADEGPPVRDRRGALHQPLGTRFSPRVSAAFRSSASGFRRRACTPSRRRPRRGSATTSSRSLACASRRCSSATSTGRI